MDLNVLIEELRSAAESLRKNPNNGKPLSTIYCHKVVKVVDKVSHWNSDYENVITGLWVIIAHFTETLDILVRVPSFKEAATRLFRECTKAVLNIQWQNLEEDSDVRQRFVVSLSNLNAKLVPLNYQRFRLLESLLENPWTDPTLAKIMGGEAEDEEEKEEVQNYIAREDAIILQLRVDMMLKENCEEYALNLCNSCLLHPELKRDLTLRKTQLSLLHKLGLRDKLQEECQNLSVQEAVNVIRQLQTRSTKEICTVLAQTFMVQHWIRQKDHKANKDLLRLWIRQQAIADKEQDRFKESVWAIAKLSQSTDQIVFFIDILREQCGKTYLQLYVDMCIFAINVDKGQMETNIKQGKADMVKARKEDMSAICGKLACLNHHASIKVARICVLTAFVLKPCSETFQSIIKFYSQNYNCCGTCNKTANVTDHGTVNPATLYEVERLLNMLRPEYLNPDNSLSNIKILCERFCKENNLDIPLSTVVPKPPDDNAQLRMVQIEAFGKVKATSTKPSNVFEAVASSSVNNAQALLRKGIQSSQQRPLLNSSQNFHGLNSSIPQIRPSILHPGPRHPLPTTISQVKGNVSLIEPYKSQQSSLKPNTSQLISQPGSSGNSMPRAQGKQIPAQSKNPTKLNPQLIQYIQSAIRQNSSVVQELIKHPDKEIVRTVMNMLKQAGKFNVGATNTKPNVQQQQQSPATSFVGDQPRLPTVSTLLRPPTIRPRSTVGSQGQQSIIPPSSSSMAAAVSLYQSTKPYSQNISSHSIKTPPNTNSNTAYMQKAESFRKAKLQAGNIRSVMHSSSLLHRQQVLSRQMSGSTITVNQSQSGLPGFGQGGNVNSTQNIQHHPTHSITQSHLSTNTPSLSTFNNQSTSQSSLHNTQQQQLQSSALSNSLRQQSALSSDELSGSIMGIDDKIITELLQDAGIFSNTFPDIEVDSALDDLDKKREGRTTIVSADPQHSASRIVCPSTSQGNIGSSSSIAQNQMLAFDLKNSSSSISNSKRYKSSLVPPVTQQSNVHGNQQQFPTDVDPTSDSLLLPSKGSMPQPQPQMSVEQIREMMKQEQIDGEVTMDSSNNATYRCIICSLAFKVLEELREHVRNVCKPGLQSSSVYNTKIKQDRANSAKAGLETTTVFQCLRCFELCISQEGIKQHRLTCKRVPTVPPDIKNATLNSKTNKTPPASRSATPKMSSSLSQAKTTVTETKPNITDIHISKIPEKPVLPLFYSSNTKDVINSLQMTSGGICRVNETVVPSNVTTSVTQPKQQSTVVKDFKVEINVATNTSETVNGEELKVKQEEKEIIVKPEKANMPQKPEEVVPPQKPEKTTPVQKPEKVVPPLTPANYSEISGSGGCKFYRCKNCSQTLCSYESLLSHWKDCVTKPQVAPYRKQFPLDPDDELEPGEIRPLTGKVLQNVLDVIAAVAEGEIGEMPDIDSDDEDLDILLSQGHITGRHESHKLPHTRISKKEYPPQSVLSSDDNSSNSSVQASNRKISCLPMKKVGKGVLKEKNDEINTPRAASTIAASRINKSLRHLDHDDDEPVGSDEDDNNSDDTDESSREAPPTLRDRTKLKPIQSFINESFVSPYARSGCQKDSIVNSSNSRNKIKDSKEVEENASQAITESEKGDFNCIVCSKICNSKRILIQHYAGKHLQPYTMKTLTDGSSYFCHLCQKSFSTFMHYMHHVPNHGSIIMKKMTTQYCSLTQKRKQWSNRIAASRGFSVTSGLKKGGISPKRAKALLSKKKATKSARERLKKVLSLKSSSLSPNGKIKIFDKEKIERRGRPKRAHPSLQEKLLKSKIERKQFVLSKDVHLSETEDSCASSSPYASDASDDDDEYHASEDGDSDSTINEPPQTRNRSRVTRSIDTKISSKSDDGFNSSANSLALHPESLKMSNISPCVCVQRLTQSEIEKFTKSEAKEIATKDDAQSESEMKENVPKLSVDVSKSSALRVEEESQNVTEFPNSVERDQKSTENDLKESEHKNPINPMANFQSSFESYIKEVKGPPIRKKRQKTGSHSSLSAQNSSARKIHDEQDSGILTNIQQSVSDAKGAINVSDDVDEKTANSSETLKEKEVFSSVRKRRCSVNLGQKIDVEQIKSPETKLSELEDNDIIGRESCKSPLTIASRKYNGQHTETPTRDRNLKSPVLPLCSVVLERSEEVEKKTNPEGKGVKIALANECTTIISNESEVLNEENETNVKSSNLFLFEEQCLQNGKNAHNKSPPSSSHSTFVDKFASFLQEKDEISLSSSSICRDQELNADARINLSNEIMHDCEENITRVKLVPEEDFDTKINHVKENESRVEFEDGMTMNTEDKLSLENVEIPKDERWRLEEGADSQSGMLSKVSDIKQGDEMCSEEMNKKNDDQTDKDTISVNVDTEDEGKKTCNDVLTVDHISMEDVKIVEQDSKDLKDKSDDIAQKVTCLVDESIIGQEMDSDDNAVFKSFEENSELNRGKSQVRYTVEENLNDNSENVSGSNEKASEDVQVESCLNNMKVSEDESSSDHAIVIEVDESVQQETGEMPEEKIHEENIRMEMEPKHNDDINRDASFVEIEVSGLDIAVSNSMKSALEHANESAERSSVLQMHTEEGHGKEADLETMSPQQVELGSPSGLNPDGVQFEAEDARNSDKVLESVTSSLETFENADNSTDISLISNEKPCSDATIQFNTTTNTHGNADFKDQKITSENDISDKSLIMETGALQEYDKANTFKSDNLISEGSDLLNVQNEQQEIVNLATVDDVCDRNLDINKGKERYNEDLTHDTEKDGEMSFDQQQNNLKQIETVVEKKKETVELSSEHSSSSLKNTKSEIISDSCQSNDFGNLDQKEDDGNLDPNSPQHPSSHIDDANENMDENYDEMRFTTANVANSEKGYMDDSIENDKKADTVGVGMEEEEKDLDDRSECKESIMLPGDIRAEKEKETTSESSVDNKGKSVIGNIERDTVDVPISYDSGLCENTSSEDGHGLKGETLSENDKGNREDVTISEHLEPDSTESVCKNGEMTKDEVGRSESVYVSINDGTIFNEIESKSEDTMDTESAQGDGKEEEIVSEDPALTDEVVKEIQVKEGSETCPVSIVGETLIKDNEEKDIEVLDYSTVKEDRPNSGTCEEGEDRSNSSDDDKGDDELSGSLEVQNEQTINDEGEMFSKDNEETYDEEVCSINYNIGDKIEDDPLGEDGNVLNIEANTVLNTTHIENEEEEGENGKVLNIEESTICTESEGEEGENGKVLNIEANNCTENEEGEEGEDGKVLNIEANTVCTENEGEDGKMLNIEANIICTENEGEEREDGKVLNIEANTICTENEGEEGEDEKSLNIEANTICTENEREMEVGSVLNIEANTVCTENEEGVDGRLMNIESNTIHTENEEVEEGKVLNFEANTIRTEDEGEDGKVLNMEANTVLNTNCTEFGEEGRNINSEEVSENQEVLEHNTIDMTRTQNIGGETDVHGERTVCNNEFDVNEEGEMCVVNIGDNDEHYESDIDILEDVDHSIHETTTNKDSTRKDNNTDTKDHDSEALQSIISTDPLHNVDKLESNRLDEDAAIDVHDIESVDENNGEGRGSTKDNEKDGIVACDMRNTWAEKICQDEDGSKEDEVMTGVDDEDNEITTGETENLMSAVLIQNTNVLDDDNVVSKNDDERCKESEEAVNAGLEESDEAMTVNTAGLEEDDISVKDSGLSGKAEHFEEHVESEVDSVNEDCITADPGSNKLETGVVGEELDDQEMVATDKDHSSVCNSDEDEKTVELRNSPKQLRTRKRVYYGNNSVLKLSGKDDKLVTDIDDKDNYEIIPGESENVMSVVLEQDSESLADNENTVSKKDDEKCIESEEAANVGHDDDEEDNVVGKSLKSDGLSGEAETFEGHVEDEVNEDSLSNELETSDVGGEELDNQEVVATDKDHSSVSNLGEDEKTVELRNSPKQLRTRKRVYYGNNSVLKLPGKDDKVVTDIDDKDNYEVVPGESENSMSVVLEQDSESLADNEDTVSKKDDEKCKESEEAANAGHDDDEEEDNIVGKSLKSDGLSGEAETFEGHENEDNLAVDHGSNELETSDVGSEELDNQEVVAADEDHSSVSNLVQDEKTVELRNSPKQLRTRKRVYYGNNSVLKLPGKDDKVVTDIDDKDNHEVIPGESENVMSVVSEQDSVRLTDDENTVSKKDDEKCKESEEAANVGHDDDEEDNIVGKSLKSDGLNGEAETFEGHVEDEVNEDSLSNELETSDVGGAELDNQEVVATDKDHSNVSNLGEDEKTVELRNSPKQLRTRKRVYYGNNSVLKLPGKDDKVVRDIDDKDNCEILPGESENVMNVASEQDSESLTDNENTVSKKDDVSEEAANVGHDNDEEDNSVGKSLKSDGLSGEVDTFEGRVEELNEDSLAVDPGSNELETSDVGGEDLDDQEVVAADKDHRSVSNLDENEKTLGLRRSPKQLRTRKRVYYGHNSVLKLPESDTDVSKDESMTAEKSKNTDHNISITSLDEKSREEVDLKRSQRNRGKTLKEVEHKKDLDDQIDMVSKTRAETPKQVCDAEETKVDNNIEYQDSRVDNGIVTAQNESVQSIENANVSQSATISKDDKDIVKTALKVGDKKRKMKKEEEIDDSQDNITSCETVQEEANESEKVDNDNEEKVTAEKLNSKNDFEDIQVTKRRSSRQRKRVYALDKSQELEINQQNEYPVEKVARLDEEEVKTQDKGSELRKEVHRTEKSKNVLKENGPHSSHSNEDDLNNCNLLIESDKSSFKRHTSPRVTPGKKRGRKPLKSARSADGGEPSDKLEQKPEKVKETFDEDKLIEHENDRTKHTPQTLSKISIGEENMSDISNSEGEKIMSQKMTSLEKKREAFIEKKREESVPFTWDLEVDYGIPGQEGSKHNVRLPLVAESKQGSLMINRDPEGLESKNNLEKQGDDAASDIHDLKFEEGNNEEMSILQEENESSADNNKDCNETCEQRDISYQTKQISQEEKGVSNDDEVGTDVNNDTCELETEVDEQLEKHSTIIEDSKSTAANNDDESEEVMTIEAAGLKAGGNIIGECLEDNVLNHKAGNFEERVEGEVNDSVTEDCMTADPVSNELVVSGGGGEELYNQEMVATDKDQSSISSSSSVSNLDGDEKTSGRRNIPKQLRARKRVYYGHNSVLKLPENDIKPSKDENVTRMEKMSNENEDPDVSAVNQGMKVREEDVPKKRKERRGRPRKEIVSDNTKAGSEERSTVMKSEELSHKAVVRSKRVKRTGHNSEDQEAKRDNDVEHVESHVDKTMDTCNTESVLSVENNNVCPDENIEENTFEMGDKKAKTVDEEFSGGQDNIGRSNGNKEKDDYSDGFKQEAAVESLEEMDKKYLKGDKSKPLNLESCENNKVDNENGVTDKELIARKNIRDMVMIQRRSLSLNKSIRKKRMKAAAETEKRKNGDNKEWEDSANKNVAENEEEEDDTQNKDQQKEHGSDEIKRVMKENLPSSSVSDEDDLSDYNLVVEEDTSYYKSFPNPFVFPDQKRSRKPSPLSMEVGESEKEKETSFEEQKLVEHDSGSVKDFPEAPTTAIVKKDIVHDKSKAEKVESKKMTWLERKREAFIEKKKEESTPFTWDLEENSESSTQERSTSLGNSSLPLDERLEHENALTPTTTSQLKEEPKPSKLQKASTEKKGKKLKPSSSQESVDTSDTAKRISRKRMSSPTTQTLVKVRKKLNSVSKSIAVSEMSPPSTEFPLTSTPKKRGRSKKTLSPDKNTSVSDEKLNESPHFININDDEITFNTRSLSPSFTSENTPKVQNDSNSKKREKRGRPRKRPLEDSENSAQQSVKTKQSIPDSPASTNVTDPKLKKAGLIPVAKTPTPVTTPVATALSPVKHKDTTSPSQATSSVNLDVSGNTLNKKKYAKKDKPSPVSSQLDVQNKKLIPVAKIPTPVATTLSPRKDMPSPSQAILSVNRDVSGITLSKKKYAKKDKPSPASSQLDVQNKKLIPVAKIPTPVATTLSPRKDMPSPSQAIFSVNQDVSGITLSKKKYAKKDKPSPASSQLDVQNKKLIPVAKIPTPVATTLSPRKDMPSPSQAILSVNRDVSGITLSKKKYAKKDKPSPASSQLSVQSQKFSKLSNSNVFEKLTIKSPSPSWPSKLKTSPCISSSSFVETPTIKKDHNKKDNISISSSGTSEATSTAAVVKRRNPTTVRKYFDFHKSVKQKHSQPVKSQTTIYKVDPLPKPTSASSLSPEQLEKDRTLHTPLPPGVTHVKQWKIGKDIKSTKLKAKQRSTPVYFKRT